MSQVSLKQIAEALSEPKRKIERRATRETWHYSEATGRGGKRRLYALDDLPIEIQAALVKTFPELVAHTTPASVEQDDDQTETPAFTYDKEELWHWAERRPQKMRDRGAHRAMLLRQVMKLVDAGHTLSDATGLVGKINGVSAATMRGWYYGVNKQVGAKHYDPADWDAALIPGYRGQSPFAECDPRAWDWLLGQYLNRRQPPFRDSYRRLETIAKKEEWIIPCERTLMRRLKNEVSIFIITYEREGAEALNKLLPSMKRDKSCFSAGEAVSGDGLKFDKVWVDWGDEIIPTTTGWFWQDIRSNKMLAHRIAKTENTDLFRLATYDLTAICKPDYVQVDNTRVAANKAMTGKTNGRHRFHDKEDDPIGILLQLDMEVHFTDPDHTISNPGVKPVERSFGIGGIHEMVATHPKIINRGYSKKTAIPIDEFRGIVAEEVARFNARPKRRTDICRGVLSFNEAFNESFTTATVKKLTEAQRRLLLLMPEVARADKTRGMITLKAGASKLGKNRYWCEALAEYKGQKLIAYYDPENLEASISVYSMDGRFIVAADHQPTYAFNDTSAARENYKFKRRIQKAQKKIAADTVRMNELERAALYPAPDDVVIPESGVVQGNFKQKRQVLEDGSLVDINTGEISSKPSIPNDETEMWDTNFPSSLAAIRKKRMKESLDWDEDTELLNLQNLRLISGDTKED